MGHFFAELKRQHMYRIAAAYAVVAWLLIQIVNNLTPMLKLPDWIGPTVVVLLAVGFPIALLFAWILGLQSASSASAKTTRIDFTLIGALALVLAIFLYQQIAPRPGSNSGQTERGAVSIAVLPFANLIRRLSSVYV